MPTRVGIGQELVAHHGAFRGLAAKLAHGAKKGALARLSAVRVGGKPQGTVKALHARRVIVGDERDGDPCLLHPLDPGANALIGILLLVGSEGVVDVQKDCINAVSDLFRAGVHSCAVIVEIQLDRICATLCISGYGYILIFRGT